MNFLQLIEVSQVVPFKVEIKFHELPREVIVVRIFQFGLRVLYVDHRQKILVVCSKFRGEDSKRHRMKKKKKKLSNNQILCCCFSPTPPIVIPKQKATECRRRDLYKDFTRPEKFLKLFHNLISTEDSRQRVSACVSPISWNSNKDYYFFSTKIWMKIGSGWLAQSTLASWEFFYKSKTLFFLFFQLENSETFIHFDELVCANDFFFYKLTTDRRWSRHEERKTGKRVSFHIFRSE